MSKPAFEEVVNIPAGTQDARLDTLLNNPSCQMDGHERFVEASYFMLEHLEEAAEQAVGIHLLGRPGTGKTFAAVALARAVYEKADDVFARFVHVPKHNTSTVIVLNNGINSSHNSVKTNNQPFTQSAQKGLGLVVLDDFQGGQNNRSVFFNVIDQVNQSGGILIATSNEVDLMFYKDRPEALKKPEEMMMEDYFQTHGVSTNHPIVEKVADLEEARIFSRISGTMLPIIFETAIDLRASGGFWKDF